MGQILKIRLFASRTNLECRYLQKKGASCKGERFWLKNNPPSRPTPFSAPPPLQVVNIKQNQKSRP